MLCFVSVKVLVIVRLTNISEAKASLSKLVEKVLNGEEVIIAKAGKPVAKLVPYEFDKSPRDLGVRIWEGEVWMANDFNELPKSVLEQFVGEVNDEFTAWHPYSNLDI